ncbi:class I SAM-dependent methyltransferase [Marinobacterium rhizophilum]|uniref:Class I SAM-dependent methyltransferase n=1 Tax=Marinobacterium rhizophilum TaxID=420402 RepID=A0ABY5HQ61_9GAMM|nr:class I SAM-dependent methyltransferase [Marinobacterium rhizophilum]UTW14259.1 class I SAM-dependent methyltransferase [Marinobacterium rhizophilum]
MYSCPLCYSSDVSEIESLKKNDLIYIYKKDFSMDISDIIKEHVEYLICRCCGLGFFYPLYFGSENFYNQLQKHEWYYSEDKFEYTESCKYVKESQRVLEVGAGKGAFRRYLPNCEYTALEVSPKAKELGEAFGVSIINESVESHSIKRENYYDVVCSFQVLEHVPNIKSFLSSKISCLRPGGVMIVAVPTEDSFLSYAVNNALNLPPHHLSRWNKRSLEKIAKIFDLDVIDISTEPLQAVHKVWYLSVEIQKMFLRNRMLDFSLVRNIVSKGSVLIAKIVNRFFDDDYFLNGHTVIAVFKKR